MKRRGSGRMGPKRGAGKRRALAAAAVRELAQAAVPRPRRMIRNSMVSVKRKFWVSNWQPGTTTTNDFWRQLIFALDALPSHLEFVTIFDQYRINAIRVEFVPRFDNFAGNDTTDTTLPGVTNQAGTRLHILKDPYATVGPTGSYTTANLNTFMEQGGVRSYTANRPVVVYFRPKIGNMIANNTGLAISSDRVKAPWILTTSVSIPHFGFQVFAQDPNLTGTFGNSFDIFYTYYMQFKGLR